VRAQSASASVPPLIDTKRMSPDHHHTPEEEKRIREAALDETIEATFPASDPPSSVPNPDEDDVIEPEDDAESPSVR
jgi:hypothetical protein